MKKIIFILLCVFSICFLLNKNIDANDKENNTIEELNNLINFYYNKGDYIKDTEIFLTEEAVTELIQNVGIGFHADSSHLIRTTYYLGDSLWMSRGSENNSVEYSFYGTAYDGNNNAVGVTNASTMSPYIYPEDADVVLSGVGKNSMNEYYIGLEDIVAKDSHGWIFEDGVFKCSSPEVVEWFKAFTAPCYLGATKETENYVSLMEVSIKEISGQLELCLYAFETDGSKLTSDSNVFSKAVIYSDKEENETCQLYGILKDIYGEPVENAQVSIGLVNTYTNFEGYFSVDFEYLAEAQDSYDLIITKDKYTNLNVEISPEHYINDEYDLGELKFIPENTLDVGTLGGVNTALYDIYLSKEEDYFTVTGVANRELTSNDALLIYINLVGLNSQRNKYQVAIQGRGNTIDYAQYFPNATATNFTAAQKAQCKASYNGNVYKLSISYDLLDSFVGDVAGYSFKNHYYSFMMYAKDGSKEDCMTYETLNGAYLPTIYRNDNMVTATAKIKNNAPWQWIYVSKDNKFTNYESIISEDEMNYSLEDLNELLKVSGVYKEGYQLSEYMAKVSLDSSVYTKASLVKAEVGNDIHTDNNKRKFEYFCNEALLGMYYTKKPGSDKTGWYAELTAQTSGYVLLATISTDTSVNTQWTKLIDESNAHGLTDAKAFYSIYAMWVEAGDTIIVGGTTANPNGNQLLFTLANSELGA